jgi:hypothetical protein
MRDNLTTALEHAARGIAVFPVAVRKLEDGTLEKKPTIKWRDEATALRAQIRTRGNGGLRALCVRVLNAREGERNNILFWAACRAREEGGSDFAQDMLLEAARRAGLPETEARRTINSGFNR